MEEKKNKFVLLENTKLKKLWGWYLLVDSIPVLLDSLKVQAEKIALAYCNMFEIKDGLYEFEGQKTVEQGARHSTRMEWIANFIVGIACEKKGGRLELLDAIAAISDTFTKPKVDLFTRDGAFYMNQAGGFMPLYKDYKVVETSIRPKMGFPESVVEGSYKREPNIKISRWPMGTHYYAKVGGQDVKWKGEVKWPTTWEAEEAAAKFAKKYKL